VSAPDSDQLDEHLLREVLRMLSEPLRFELSSALMDKPTTKRASSRRVLVDVIETIGGDGLGDLANVVNFVNDQVLKFWNKEPTSQNPELDQGKIFIILCLALKCLLRLLSIKDLRIEPWVKEESANRRCKMFLENRSMPREKIMKQTRFGKGFFSNTYNESRDEQPHHSPHLINNSGSGPRRSYY
jgi:hypothetical protein